MRIAVNALQVRAAKSGVGQYIHALLEKLVQHGSQDEFSVYCTRENISNYSLSASNLRPVVWGLPQQARTLRLLYEYLFLPKELQRHGYDLFHGASNFLPPRKVCPYVVTIHDLSYYVHPERCPPLRRRYWYAMTARTIAVADAIITDSENSRRDIARFFPGFESRTTVIPLAAHSRFRPATHVRHLSSIDCPDLQINGRPYLLYVGTLEPGKNIVRIIEAFDQIADSFPDHVLVLVGDRGWLFESIFAAARDARHATRILFPGHLPDEQVVELFSFCDAFIYPSLYEGFGLPPLEAMACGAPVITSNTSSVPEVVGDAALTLDPRSTEQIGSAIRQVLGSADLRQELRARGLARASIFSWEKTARQTLEVYHKAGRR